MRLLLDTHIAVWVVEDNPALTTKARNLLMQDDAVIYVSAASIWEIAIKSALRAERRDGFGFTAEEAHQLFVESGMEILDIKAEHAAAVSDLPMLHADPFDRIMVAQAHCAGLHFVTHDRALVGYGDHIIRV